MPLIDKVTGLDLFGETLWFVYLFLKFTTAHHALLYWQAKCFSCWSNNANM